MSNGGLAAFCGPGATAPQASSMRTALTPSERIWAIALGRVFELSRVVEASK